ncbi:MAG: thiamine diphosphokinase [Pseudomonadota bacterium]
MNPKPKAALVVLNGAPPSRSLVRRLARGVDLIVAADGGANILRKYNVHPDVVIGDLDSIEPVTRRRLKSARFVRLENQDSTDFEKALVFLVRERVSRVFVLGAEGKRIDFTLGNFASIWKFVPHLRVSLLGEDWLAVPVTKNLELSVPAGTTVSLIPYTACSGVTLKGFRYPLRNARLRVESLGISNVTKVRRSSIRLRKGRFLVVALGRFAHRGILK